MYQIIQKRKIWFIFSGLLILASLGVLIFWGFKLGIDFTGGTLMRIEFKKERPSNPEIINSLANLNLGEIRVQLTQENDVVLRMKDINNETRQGILHNLGLKFGEVQEKSFESIGPTIGKELRQKALMAIIIVLGAIILYITWAFRKVSLGPVSSWAYGLGAIVALAHDILIVTGIFVVLGHFLQIEIDILFITALLTILGFSVHDTIVVYDRIREGLRTIFNKSFEEIINESINNTLARSLNTSITALFVLFALYLFGGESIKYFVLALIIGIITGTYSSIFIASPFLLVWRRLTKR